MAFPARYVISPEIIGTSDATRIKEACKYDAVDLEMEAKTLNLNVGGIVWSTGWQPYDAAKIDYLGFGQYPNVITGLELKLRCEKDECAPIGTRETATVSRPEE